MLARSGFRSLAAGVGDSRQIHQETFAFVCRQNRERFHLQDHGPFAHLRVFFPAEGQQFYAMGTAILFVPSSFQEAVLLHAFQERCHGVRVTAHELSQLTLGHAFGIAFEQNSHDREMVRSHAGVRDASAEGLV